MSTETARYNDFNQQLIADLRAHAGRATSGPFEGRELLILTTRGARSGELRETPLAFSESGDDYVIVGSKGGAPTHPAWFHNLQKDPDVIVEVRGEKFRAHARLATDEEYEKLYKVHADRMPSFGDYRKRTNRKLPVIVLSRRGSAG
jgi:deazaflavin-dependent oxidoreductase (nitroreductase family)